jgi:hypothetical protein
MGGPTHTGAQHGTVEQSVLRRFAWMVSWVVAAARMQSECAHPRNFADVAYSKPRVRLGAPKAGPL